MAQTATSSAAEWTGGFGVGNGLELHASRLQQHGLLLGRVRYKIWGPSSGPGSGWFDGGLNTYARQAEVAALAGYSLPLGKGLLYGAAGLSYLYGRQLGEYRYTIHQNSLLGDATHYYAYRDYQAVGIPLELGVLAHLKRPADVRPGLTFQANLNPEQPVYCVLLTFWISDWGKPIKSSRR